MNETILDEPFESEDAFTLAVIHHGGAIALGRKTRGYGKGKLVLPGGKDHYYLSSMGIGLVPGTAGASREVHEELGIAIRRESFKRVGMLFIATEAENKNIALYEAHRYNADLPGSDELNPVHWHNTESLPYDEMPSDYKHWLPHVLAGYAVTAFFETEDDRIVDGSLFRQRLEPLERMERLPVEVTE